MNPNVFDKILAFAPPRPAIHLFIARGSNKKERYVLLWKNWRIEGANGDEIIKKLMTFKKFGYHLL